jgi:uncharacterized protein YvpB
LKQVMKKGLLFMIVAAFFNIIVGCSSQVNETEKLVKSAEKLSSSLKNDIDYMKRLKKDKEQAFAIPDQELVTKTESAFEKAKKSIHNIKDNNENKRLNSIKLVIANALAITTALNRGDQLNQSEKELVAFYIQNPLSGDLETKVNEFEKMAPEKDTLQKSLPSDWQKPFEENVLKDSTTVLQNAKAMAAVQKNLGSLTTLINQGNKTEIDKKMTEIKSAIAGIQVEPAKTALNAKLSEVSKPYLDKIAQEAKKVAEAKKAQEAQKVAASATGTTAPKSPSPSSSTKTLAATQSPVVTLNVPYVSQLTPTYAPMGCEGASLLMGLKYKGYTNESLKTLLDKMPKSTNNPYAAFAGSPYKIINGVFQSIFPRPLTAFGQTYSSKVANATGYTTTQLKNELDHGNPAVIYVTLKFARPVWAKYNMGSAGYVNIVDNMHVMTLIGYNKNTGSYYVADPDSKLSSDKYWVSKSAFETSYNALKYAVVVR